VAQSRPTTNNVGIPVASDDHSLTLGPNGPILLQDHYLIEKNAQFNRERVPERVVHAKGGGAFGFFQVTEDISQFTKAALFQPSTTTDVLVRFSTVAGELGSPDTWRDPRGFAMKFYTTQGNYDIVGNNTPVFFIRDPIKFPDFIRSQKRRADNHLRDNNMQWDFWTLRPESAHQVTWLMGDRGLPKTWRNMNGYGSHTFLWENASGERFWIKYHFKTEQGIDFLTQADADEMAGTDGDYHIRDLWTAIDSGNAPSWRLEVQVMPYADAADYRFNPFDLTKVWPHEDYPPITVGRMVLNRNPANYFADVEQVAFNPANVPPGIGFSPDKMLQGRLFSYGDAQRYRLGVNHYQIPVNAPRCPFTNFHRDGQMRVDGNAGGTLHYEPNSYGQWQEQPDYREPPLSVEGAADHWDHRKDDDYYSQPGALFRLMTHAQQQALFDNTARATGDAPEDIKLRHARNCGKADPEYGAGVLQALGFSPQAIGK